MLYRLSNPAPGRPVTSPYGPRRHPISGQLGKMHRGIDYGGTFDVLSAGDGVVHKVSYNGNKRTGGGHVVIIKHATDCFTAYYHGAYKSPLKVGQRVSVGDVIYLSGSTGASTGPHLHFEVRTGRLGQWGTDTDPGPYFSANSAPTASNNTVKVTGRLNNETWKAWQEVLRDHGYTGVIDGKPGPMTYRAIQRSVGAKEDGIMGSATRRAVQKHLGVKEDGNWGPTTISALQRALNSGTY
jgi:murein DD-endopeptidase MepM/ murein hydrolase activator NlpD